MDNLNLLSSEDLFNLTGRKQKEKQIAMLQRMGIDHFTRWDGKPVVTWHQVNSAKGDREFEPKFAEK